MYTIRHNVNPSPRNLHPRRPGAFPHSGDYIGSASFQDALKETTAFKKLMLYVNQTLTKASASDYKTIEDDYYRAQANYAMVDHQDYFTLSVRYGNPVRLSEDLILNEHFYLLQKR